MHELILHVHQLFAFLGYSMLMKGNDGVLAITLCGNMCFPRKVSARNSHIAVCLCRAP